MLILTYIPPHFYMISSDSVWFFFKFLTLVLLQIIEPRVPFSNDVVITSEA
jgi:hypothetical protein